ncbi:hypothetical protein RYX36_010329 [Vicia faba]
MIPYMSLSFSCQELMAKTSCPFDQPPDANLLAGFALPCTSPNKTISEVCEPGKERENWLISHAHTYNSPCCCQNQKSVQNATSSACIHYLAIQPCILFIQEKRNTQENS